MPIDKNGMNSDTIEYFSLQEYIDRISLLPFVLEHLEDTNKNFKEYIKKLVKYDEKYVIDYWIYLLYEELQYNQKIENLDYQKIDLIKNEVFFDTLTISNKRIHRLHTFATDKEFGITTQYRKTEANVSRFGKNGEQEIFWRGAQAKDVERFMNDFIKIYKQNDISLIMSNPFLKSSLIHLLFLRIHPYADGNGRTARLLHNSKFTEGINRIYGTNLRISPLNLSESILINKISYINSIDHIYFDIKNDTNLAINKWFDTMLNMADEQIYSASNKLDMIDPSLLREFQTYDDKGKMKLKKLI